MARPDHDIYAQVASCSPGIARELKHREGDDGLLTLQDFEDFVQDGLEEAIRRNAGEGHTFEQLRAYVRTVAERRAVSRVRHVSGEGGATRIHLAHDEQQDHREDPELDELHDEDERRSHTAIVRAAYNQLTPVHRKVLHDRYTLDIPVAKCAEARGLKRRRFEDLFTEAVNRLRIIVEHTNHDACMQCRFELDVANDPNAPVDKQARMKALGHLDAGCLACRTYVAQVTRGKKGRRGLLGALPLPLLVERSHGAAGRIPLLTRHADAISTAAAAADPVTTTGATTATGAGGALLLGVTAKTVTVGACALLATGACLLGGRELLKPPHTPHPAKNADAPAKKAIVAAVAASGSAIAPAHSRSGYLAVPAAVTTTKRATHAAKTRRTSRTSRQTRATAGNASAPVIPTRTAAPAPTYIAPALSAAPARPTAVTPATVAPRKAAPPSSSPFSTEFSP